MKLNVMEILKQLPRTNCRECGEVTCMAFAAKLAKAEVPLEDCKPLFAEKYAQNLASLRELSRQAA
jgi:ArsR family metal-binding transcriptional regulator